MHFNNIIIDLDGTLVDSFQDISEALTAAAINLGLPAPKENTIRENMHLRLDQLIQTMYPDANQLNLIQQFRGLYDSSGYPNTRPYPGVVATLKLLHQRGFRLFVATNKRKIAADVIVSRFNAQNMIEQVITSDISDPPLSKDELVHKIITEKKLNPKYTVLVGDTQGDWESSIVNGLFFIYAEYGYGRLEIEDNQRLNFISISSFSQLEEYII